MDERIFKAVDSAEWFQFADKWLKICFSYNNPINYGSIHSEFNLLNYIKNNLVEITDDNIFIFYGIGSGDTEMQVLDIFSKRFSNIHCYGVDINNIFLDLFESSVKLKAIENTNSTINYHKVHCHFNEFGRPISELNNLNIFILGSTIGNYNDINEFISLLNNTVITGDKIFISFQTDKYIKQIFKKYKDNKLYNDLINIKKVDISQIVWNLNNNKIEAFYDDTQLFRSVKYSPDELKDLFEKAGYRFLDMMIDDPENLCLLVVQK